MDLRIRAWLSNLLSQWNAKRMAIVFVGIAWWLLDDRYQLASRVNQLLNDANLRIISPVLQWIVQNLLRGFAIIGTTIAALIVAAFFDSRRQAKKGPTDVAQGATMEAYGGCDTP